VQSNLAKLSARSKEQQQKIEQLHEQSGMQQVAADQQQQETKVRAWEGLSNMKASSHLPVQRIIDTNTKLASTADKARSRAVEIDLRTLDAEQASRHIEYAVCHGNECSSFMFSSCGFFTDF
jgi:hypothetical protein